MLVDTRLQVLVLRCFGTGWFPPEVSRFRIRRSPGDDVMDGSRRDMKGVGTPAGSCSFSCFCGENEAHTRVLCQSNSLFRR